MAEKKEVKKVVKAAVKAPEVKKFGEVLLKKKFGEAFQPKKGE